MPRGRSTAGALRRGLKKVTGIVGSGSLLATALVVGGLGAGAAQAVPLSDNADSIYGIRGPAGTSLNGGVFRINTGTMSVVAPAEVTGQLNGTRSSNALGISADGVYVYTVDNGTTGSSTPSGAVQLRQHNTETGVTNTYNVPTAFGTTTLRGAVSPVTGIFYFSGSQTVYAFNPATEQIFAAGSLPQGTSNANGDFAFGRNGNLYTFVAANLYETPASALPTSASSSNLPMNLIATVSAFTALSSQGANGIAFGGNGYVYGTTTSGNNTHLIEYDIASSSVVDQKTISADGNNFVDLASRHFLNTLTLRLDLPDGRYADSDQFRLDIDGEGDLLGAAATTTGTATGLQGAYAGPVIAAQGGGYGVSAEAAAGADLSNYTTSIACTDGAGNAVATTGSPSNWSIVFPTVTSGTDVDCIITATPIPDVPDAPPTTDDGVTTGPQGVPQSWTPTPVAGDSPVDWSTLTLLEGDGDPVDEIVVPGVGRYEIVDDEIVFTPVPTFVGPAPTVDYRISDEAGQHATGTYTPTVTAVTPVAADDSSVGRPNQPQSVNPLLNDVPGDPAVPLDPTTVKLVDPTTSSPVETVTVPEGVYTIDTTDPAAPKIVFTPNENYVGTPTPVDYAVDDANGTQTGAEYQPQVVTDPPAVNDGTTTGPQGLPQSWTPTPVAGDDFPIEWSTLTLLDDDGDPVEQIVVPGTGTYTVDGHALVFTPEPAFVGQAPTVDFRISDEGGQHATGTYTPAITAVTPVAVDDASTGGVNLPQSVAPLANDTPGDPGVPLVPSTLKLVGDEGSAVETVTVPEGVYTIDRTDPSTPRIVFTPNENYFGTPTPVDYTVEDANGTQTGAEYQPDVVADGPTTDNGTSSGPQGLPQDWTPTPVAGDFPIADGSLTLLDDEGDPVSSIVVPGVGTYTVAGDKLVFTPEPAFVGDAPTVSYQVADEADQTATGTYTPTVTAVTPVANDDTSTDSPNQPQSVDPLANDVPGDPEVPLVPESLKLVDPESGDPVETVTVPEGVYTIDRTDPDAPLIVFTPNENYFGTPTPVDYTVEDANGTPAGATYQPEVPAEAPTTNSGETTGPQGQPQSWTPTPVPGFDFPVDWSTLTLLDGDGDPVDEIVVPGVGRYEIVDDEIVFTPVPTFVGPAPTVDYRISDEAGQHATGTYTPTVTAVTPVAADDSSVGRPNQPQSVNPLLNDAPGNPVVPLAPETLKLVNPESGDPVETVTVSEGVYTIDRTDPDAPRIVFTPNENYFGTPTPVDYTVDDANGTPAGAEYQPQVVTDPPAVNDGATTGPQGLPQSWTPEPVAGDDFPVDWSTLTLVDAEGDPVAQIVVDGVGTYTVAGHEIVFTPEPAFIGDAPTVDFRISDEGGQHAFGQYTPSTFAVVPVADDDASTGWWNTPQSVNPLLNDAPGNPGVPLAPETLTLLDGEGTPVDTVTVPEGVYTIDRTDPDAPLIVFTPNRGFTGIPTPVDYRVLDANGTPAEAAYQPVVRGPEGNENLAQTLVCGTDMVFDLGLEVAGLDRGSVTLVDAAGVPVTVLVVDGEGTWRLDVETGVVTFTPEGCFLGELTPVNWEGWLLDGTPVSGELSGTYVKKMPATGGDAGPVIGFAALGALLLAAGGALLIRRRRAIA